MYSVTKWMLVAALIGANSDAIARAQAYSLDSVAGDTSCRAPFLCTTGVRPNLEGFLNHGTPRSPEGGSFLPVDDLDGAPGSVGYKKGHHGFNPGRFTCGEVVSGYAVTCTTWPTTRTTVSAPEIDASMAVSGSMFVMGCLAILHARKRRFADILERSQPLEP